MGATVHGGRQNPRSGGAPQSARHANAAKRPANAGGGRSPMRTGLSSISGNFLRIPTNNRLFMDLQRVAAGNSGTLSVD